jgi:tRNA-specific 2-thiouridylase
VIAAMSGGVDSSVAAALLVEAGYNVIGVTMKLFCLNSFEGLGTQSSCCSLESVKSAVSVAEKLDIPHTVVDMEDAFREEVLKDFFEEYSNGRTPNPCILCNSRIKFDHLYRKSRTIGADYLATGHYARISTAQEESKPLYTLQRARDTNKDQSYFLWQMTQPVLSRTLFPCGEFEKNEVREKARIFGLEVADRPESQDLCFFSPGEIKNTSLDISSLYEFGLRQTSTMPGPIVNTEGKRVGTHEGIAFYTTGQRHGLGIALGRPAYVVRIDPSRNTLVVGFEEDTLVKRFTITKPNWIAGQTPEPGFSCSVKVRSRSVPRMARFLSTSSDSATLELDTPKKAVTPGQSAVFYEDSLLIGGGVIDQVIC